MDIAQALSELQQHLEHGAELAASRLPVVLELAQEFAADPLVQTAYKLDVPTNTKLMLAGFLKSFEAEAQAIAQAATQAEAQRQAAAQAEAAQPPPDAPPAV